MAYPVRDLPIPDPGPDILTLVTDPDLLKCMEDERRAQQERLLAPRLPSRHYAKVDQITLPPELDAWDWSTGGPLIWGPRGTGKTQAATALLVACIRRLRVQASQVAFVSTSKLYVDLRRKIDDKTVSIPELDHMRQARLVVAEDLGKERPSEWVVEQNFVLFDDLYARDVKLIVTTNYSPDELYARVGEFAGDRIKEMTRPFHMDGDSHR